MNCKDIEARIFLYDELTAAEREQVDAHAAHCDSCRAALETHQSFLSKIRSTKVDIMIDNPANMTRKIMDATNFPQQRRLMLFPGLEPSLRVAFSVMSIVICATFGYEFTRTGVSDKIPVVRETLVQAGSSLNTTAFLKKNRERKQNSSSSWSDCLNSCRQNPKSDACQECLARTNHN